MTKKYVASKIKVTADNKCDLCSNSRCCTYITQEIDAPRSKADFEHLLWQVSHQNIQTYKDEDGWYLLINNASTLGPLPMPQLAAYSLDAVRRVFEVNTIAPLALVQGTQRYLTAAGGL